MQKELFLIIKNTFNGGEKWFYGILDNSHGIEPYQELEILKKQVGTLFDKLEVI